MSIAIVNYGMANLRSVQKAFEEVGAQAEIVSQPEQIRRASKIVLPGVGAFQDAVKTLRASGLVEPIEQHIQSGKWFLGICLGLQMLFDISYEDGEHQGLGIVPGKVVRFDIDRRPTSRIRFEAKRGDTVVQSFSRDERALKVPHMGWNQLQIKRPSPLLKDLPAGCGVYFVHSYHVVPTDSSVVATTTDYGGDFVSSIWRDNVLATQFHPEKSQKIGLQILANFAGL
jgi:glutamine amidotransferase